MVSDASGSNQLAQGDQWWEAMQEPKSQLENGLFAFGSSSLQNVFTPRMLIRGSGPKSNKSTGESQEVFWEDLPRGTHGNGLLGLPKIWVSFSD